MKSILAKLKGGKKDSPSQEILVKNPFEDGQSDSGNSSGKSSQEHEKSNQLNADLEGDGGTTREGSQEFNGDVVEEETKNDTDVDDSSNPEVVIDSTNELKNVTILDKQGESEDASESSKKKIKEKKPKAKKELTIKQKKKLFLPKDIGLRKPKPPTNVLILNPKKHHQNSTLRKFIIVFVGLFYEYANITKVNGMYHLRKNVTTGWLRLLWSCIILSLLCFAGTLNYMLYRRYIDSPTRVTIAAPMPISSIPFPGVTICHPQNVMEYKSMEFVKKL
ncbi:CLUMA_CG014981, isoform A [Clunio marinus]|uniref:CLUMA_CG014981, isoform A n=1 Tax=Clunio marinus TaxID=568069 RepID=A0A1J1INF8_9DIPT|nr:CLUMA_CG014981, isoform A [Clunio marinus]